MIPLTNGVAIAESEIELNAIRAQGAGGQNVNKVSTAVHLRFDINASSLPPFFKDRLLKFSDRRISTDGVVIIKAQKYRSQEKNREEAIIRLIQLIKAATTLKKPRKPTKPTKSSQRKRLESKDRKGRTKALRGRVLE